MICEPGEVVVVPFPFVDRRDTKRRPALVVSARSFNEAGHTVLAMITTKTRPAWPHDVPLTDLGRAGLPRPCIVRFKLFTLDNRLLQRRCGDLGKADGEAARSALDRVLTRARPSGP